MTNTDSTVVITGASSGIGRALAFELAGRGHSLGRTARRLPLLAQLRDEIHAAHGEQRLVEVAELDVSCPLRSMPRWHERRGSPTRIEGNRYDAGAQEESMTRAQRSRVGAVVLAALVWLPRPGLTEPAIEPKAAEILRTATSYLAGLERFSAETDNALDVVLASGQKLQFENPAKVTVRRPDRLRAERVGDLVDQLFVYDGKSLTLHDRGRGYYATVPAPATLDETLAFAQDSLDIVAPAADLLYGDAFRVLTEDATSGVYLGPATVGGVRCHHLAFTGPEVDWQLWVEDGPQPLPRKYVITSKLVPGAPEFAVWLRRFDAAAAAPDELFAFAPPEKAERIEFLQLTAQPAAPGAPRSNKP